MGVPTQRALGRARVSLLFVKPPFAEISEDKCSGGSLGVPNAGFAPSAFTRPLHTNYAAASEVPAPPPGVPPIPAVTRTSDPLPKRAPGPECGSPKHPQQELKAGVPLSKDKLLTEKAPLPSAATTTLPRKRSQSAGSRLPRPAWRPPMNEYPPNAGIKVSATTIASKLPVPSVISKSPRPFSRLAQNGGNPHSPIEGPRQQNRGRKTHATVPAVSKGAENAW